MSGLIKLLGITGVSGIVAFGIISDFYKTPSLLEGVVIEEKGNAQKVYEGLKGQKNVEYGILIRNDSGEYLVRVDDRVKYPLPNLAGRIDIGDTIVIKKSPYSTLDEKGNCRTNGEDISVVKNKIN